MKVDQIYTGCLAQGAYYIESNGEAAVIDPLRECQPYIDMAERRKARIRYVFETHFHADFVSGHVDLARKTGAEIVIGPTKMQTGFPCIIGEDGQEFILGGATIKLLHTPGHTMESSCFLLTDEYGKETALFTGDTLFIGDVGRPDLAQHVIAELTEEKLAGHLFDSLRNKILPLSDDIIVYPAHGAGSACGKKMSTETQDTLGHQKLTNYALDPSLSREDFIKQLLHGLTPPPGYFPKNVLMNITGYDSIDEVMQRGTKPLTASAFKSMASETGALIIDTRDAKTFAAGFIPGAINIGLKGNFAVWAGTLIPDINQPLLLVTDEGTEEEVVTRLARVGYDHAIGYLQGGMTAWQQANGDIDTIESISAEMFCKKYEADPALPILDVRKKSEFDSEHIETAINTPLDYINQHMQLIDRSKTWYVHCAGGYRSMVFISIMRARGYRNLVNVEGGFAAIRDLKKCTITDYVCPTTLL